MKDHHHKVIQCLLSARWHDECFCVMPFAAIMKRTGLDRATVRRTCRYLKRRGYAEFVSGLVDEDGELAGAGYCATDKAAKEFEVTDEALETA